MDYIPGLSYQNRKELSPRRYTFKVAISIACFAVVHSSGIADNSVTVQGVFWLVCHAHSNYVCDVRVRNSRAKYNILSVRNILSMFSSKIAIRGNLDPRKFSISIAFSGMRGHSWCTAISNVEMSQAWCQKQKCVNFLLHTPFHHNIT